MCRTLLIVWWDVVRPEVFRCARLTFRLLWQGRPLTVERYADKRPEAGLTLEDRLQLAAGGNQRADPRTALSSEVANLNAAAAEHGDSPRIRRVLGFRHQLDQFAGCADLDLEAATRAALVGEVSADDGEAES